MAAHRAGTADSLDIEAETNRYLNRAVMHMFEDDGVTLKPEFANQPESELPDGVKIVPDDEDEELHASIAALPESDRAELLISVRRRTAQLAARAAAEAPQAPVVVSDVVLPPSDEPPAEAGSQSSEDASEQPAQATTADVATTSAGGGSDEPVASPAEPPALPEP